MSERHTLSPESEQQPMANHETETSAVQHERAANLELAATEQAEQLKEVRHEIDLQTDSKKEVIDKLRVNEARDESVSRAPANQELKDITLKGELKHIRKRLNRRDQLVSKVIHQPVVRVLSDVSSKTITRPSGLLGGGIVAFVGTSSYYLFTKHVGIKYNYLIFVMLFVAGFALGLFIEVLLWSVHSKKRVS
jgi:hypothetical protein